MGVISLIFIFLVIFLILLIVKKVVKVIFALMIFLILIFCVFGCVVYQDFSNFKDIFEEGNVNFVFYADEDVKFGYNSDFLGEMSYKELELDKELNHEILKGYSDLLVLIEINSLDSFIVDEIVIGDYVLDKGEVLDVLKGDVELDNISKTELFFANIEQKNMDEQVFFDELINLYNLNSVEIYKEPMTLKLFKWLGLLDLLESYINK